MLQIQPLQLMISTQTPTIEVYFTFGKLAGTHFKKQ